MCDPHLLAPHVLEIVHPHVPRDANDVKRVTVNGDWLADRVPIWEEPPHEQVVDDRDPAGGTVALREPELGARKNVDAHRREVARSGRSDVGKDEVVLAI